MHLSALLPSLILSALSSATLLIDYTGSSPASQLGSCQLEGAELGDHIACPGNSSIYIKPGTDSEGTPALHYHRDATFRRAEVKGLGEYAAGKTYFVGYEFKLGNVHEHLAIFQWKNQNSAGDQNIVFNLQFTESVPSRLSLGYTPPGDKYQTLWTDGSDFAVDETHNIALAWDTKSGNNNNLQMWLDGKSVIDKVGLSLWPGDAYPKWGIYRGEKGDHDEGDESNIFDSWVYRVQLSDSSLNEVAASSGVKGAGGNSRLRRHAGVL